MEEKDKIKLEFEYLKSIHGFLIVALFGIIAYVFNNNLNTFMNILSIITINLLIISCLYTARKIMKLYER